MATGIKWVVLSLLACIVGGITMAILGKGDATLMAGGIGLVGVAGAGIAKIVQSYIEEAKQHAVVANERADRAATKATAAVDRAERAEAIAEQSSTQVGLLLTELQKPKTPEA